MLFRSLEGRVRSLKEVHKEFCDNVDGLYLAKCVEVNRLTGIQTEIRLQEAADEI